MADIEKVISDLEQQIRWIEEIECHKFPGWLNATNTMRDAIELLKEQDAVEPLAKQDDTYECICGTIVGWDELDASGIVPACLNYCPFCGKPISWECR